MQIVTSKEYEMNNLRAYHSTFSNGFDEGGTHISKTQELTWSKNT
jgi:hypothetical protein